jgi:serine/threonine protein phosphatase PrpC
MLKSPYKCLCFAISDVGNSREKNEDAFVALREQGLFLIADGMGGHNAGEIASALAVDAMKKLLSQKTALTEEKMKEAFAEVNKQIYQKSLQDEALSGMGTTLTAFALQGDEGLLAHVGDSRLYLWREGSLRLLTKDHSLLNEMLDLGVLSPENKDFFPYKHILTQAIGTNAVVTVTTGSLPLHLNDLFLLVTDGLVNELSDTAIAALLKQPKPLAELTADLIAEAKKAGGGDNITAILVKIDDLSR